jgi:hypothetical protein
MKKHRSPLAGWALLAGFLFSGCAAVLLAGGAAAGVGAVMYVKGELKTTDEVSLDKAWDCALVAVQKLELKVTQREKDALTAKMVVQGAEGEKIQIAMKSQSAKRTEIRVRVGMLGDKSLSERILEEIEKQF